MTTFQKYVQFLRTQFPPGSRVLLTSKGNQESPVDKGSQGTLAKVDSAGRFLVDSISPSRRNDTAEMNGESWKKNRRN